MNKIIHLRSGRYGYENGFCRKSKTLDDLVDNASNSNCIECITIWKEIFSKNHPMEEKHEKFFNDLIVKIQYQQDFEQLIKGEKNMTRIRYTKLNDGTLVNKSPLTGYTVQITANNEWTVFNSSNELVKNGSATSVASAKKAVKAALLTLGITFAAENRSRKGLTALAAKIV